MLNPNMRLQALAAFDRPDSPSEPEFDDIAQLARRLCRTKIALIRLVTADRQWIRAKSGFPACEIDLDRTVSKHALDVDGLVVILDLAADPSTRDNPLVTGALHIRFYAGAVQRTREGVVLETLRVIDATPRPV